MVLPDLGRPTKAELLRALEGHVIEEAQLIGLYEKSQLAPREALPPGKRGSKLPTAP